MKFQIGIIPLPIFVVLLGLVAGFVLTGKVPSDILMAIVLLPMGGFTCAELSKRLPLIGAAAIFATFIPSALATCANTKLGQRVHLPLPFHCLDHRRQHPRYG
jgi:Na+/citrate or Na+/malate symporter